MWVMREPAWRLYAVVGACQTGQAVACAVVERRPAYLGSRDADGAVAVAGDVGHAGDVAGEVAGRRDTCLDSSCGRPSRNASLPYKSGRARWNMRWKIAKGDVGSTGPGMCGLALSTGENRAVPERGEVLQAIAVVAAGITSKSQMAGEVDGMSLASNSDSTYVGTRWQAAAAAATTGQEGREGGQSRSILAARSSQVLGKV